MIKPICRKVICSDDYYHLSFAAQATYIQLLVASDEKNVAEYFIIPFNDQEQQAFNAIQELVEAGFIKIITKGPDRGIHLIREPKYQTGGGCDG